MFKFLRWYFFVKPEHVVDDQGKPTYAIEIVREWLAKKKFELWNTFPESHYLEYVKSLRDADKIIKAAKEVGSL